MSPGSAPILLTPGAPDFPVNCAPFADRAPSARTQKRSALHGFGGSESGRPAANRLGAGARAGRSAPNQQPVMRSDVRMIAVAHVLRLEFAPRGEVPKWS